MMGENRKEAVEQVKNRRSRKSMKSVWLMSVGHFVVEKVCGKICFSLEWKSEGVLDDDGDEGEEDWLAHG